MSFSVPTPRSAARRWPADGRPRRISATSPPSRDGRSGFAAPPAAGVAGGRLWVAVGDQRRDLCAVVRARPARRPQSLQLAGRRRRGGRPSVSRSPASPRRCARFAGVPHRLQVVGVVAGVTYVNDSKATNVDAALKALTAYSGPVHLILGGSLKGATFDDLAAGVEGRVREVVLIGQAAAPLREAFERRRAVVGERATPVRGLRRPRGGVRTPLGDDRHGRCRPAQSGLRQLRSV